MKHCTFAQICVVEERKPLIRNAECGIVQGTSTFEEYPKAGCMYADKSLLVKEVLDPKNQKVVLITAPPKWGKTTNLEMIRYFAQKRTAGDSSSLRYFSKGEIVFQNGTVLHLLNPPLISKEENFIQKFLGRCIVIKLDLSGKNLECNFDAYFAKFAAKIATAFKEHAPQLKNILGHRKRKGELKQNIEDFRQLNLLEAALGAKVPKPMHQRDIETCISTLCRLLHTHVNENIVILLDEYDSIYNYLFFKTDLQIDEDELQRIITSFERFIDSTFNQNCKYFYKAVITGIMRVGGLNMYGVVKHSIVDSVQIAPYYGFSGNDVKEFMKYMKMNEEFEEVVVPRFEGYRTIGNLNVSLFNPLAVAKYINSKTITKPASSHNVLRSYLRYYKIRVTIQSLLPNNDNSLDYAAKTTNNLEISIAELQSNRNYTVNPYPSMIDDKGIEAFYKILLYSGYMTLHTVQHNENEFNLALPNQEIVDEVIELIGSIHQSHFGNNYPLLRETAEELIAFFNSNDKNSKKLESAIQKLISKNSKNESILSQFHEGNETFRDEDTQGVEDVDKAVIHSIVNSVVFDLMKINLDDSTATEPCIRIRKRIVYGMDFFLYKKKRALVIQYESYEKEDPLWQAIRGNSFYQDSFQFKNKTKSATIGFDVVKYLGIGLRNGTLNIRCTKIDTALVVQYLKGKVG